MRRIARRRRIPLSRDHSPIDKRNFDMKRIGVIRRRALFAAGLVAVLFTAACGDDNPAAPIPGAGDPENISRVTVELTPVGGGATITSERVDPDGTQLPDPVGAANGTLALSQGTTYDGTIELLNDLDPNDVVEINEEIEEEANFHRFFYSFDCDGVTVPEGSLDLDTQTPTAYPVGLHYQVVVDADAPTTSSCTLHVELHHFETDKGDGLGSTYETDLSIDFPVTVE